MKKIAVVLCGSGFKDGSEIRESVATLWALSQHHIQVQCFAPDALQYDVVNCLTGEVEKGETRNMLVESARIARGNVKALNQLEMMQYHGLIIPGGFGAAKNLCTFAREGSKGSVLADLKKSLDQCMQMNKPIGAICIAPAIIGLAFKNLGLSLTVGARSEVALEIEKMGHKHIECQADQFHYDPKYRVATTPAYMFDDAPLHKVFAGIKGVVDQVVAVA